VTSVVSRRQIMVTQANWVHHHIGRNDPVVDVSPGNDWSEVRVCWDPIGQLGSRSTEPTASSIPEARSGQAY
jgi:hypothetical protein